MRSTTRSGATSGRGCFGADYQGFLHKLLNRDHLDKAHAFFEKHGGMAVVSGRFVPIVRTFVRSSPARRR